MLGLGQLCMKLKVKVRLRQDRFNIFTDGMQIHLPLKHNFQKPIWRFNVVSVGVCSKPPNAPLSPRQRCPPTPKPLSVCRWLKRIEVWRHGAVSVWEAGRGRRGRGIKTVILSLPLSDKKKKKTVCRKLTKIRSELWKSFGTLIHLQIATSMLARHVNSGGFIFRMKKRRIYSYYMLQGLPWQYLLYVCNATNNWQRSVNLGNATEAKEMHCGKEQQVKAIWCENCHFQSFFETNWSHG